MFELMIKDHIASAHWLRGYQGKCKDLHGHTWTIEVFITADELDELGMIADFSVIKKALKDFLVHLDHTCLNELDYFKQYNPTAEHIAKYIFDHFRPEIEPVRISRVRVWESPNAYAEYSSD